LNNDDCLNCKEFTNISFASILEFSIFPCMVIKVILPSAFVIVAPGRRVKSVIVLINNSDTFANVTILLVPNITNEFVDMVLLDLVAYMVIFLRRILFTNSDGIGVSAVIFAPPSSTKVSLCMKYTLPGPAIISRSQYLKPA